MTADPKDASAALDALEEIVEARRAEPDVLMSELATLTLSLQLESPHRPRVHRLLGVVNNRLGLDRKALAELRRARADARSANRPDYLELAKIGRETALIYAWRGDDHRAAAELLPALAYASLADNKAEIAKIIAEFGRIELEAQRFDNVAMLFGHLVSQKSGLTLPEREALRVRINLCQALNRLGRHDEVLQHASDLKSELSESETRLRFLTRLEEARAYAGQGRHDVAGQTLHEAKTLLPEKESAFEHSEFVEAEVELQALAGGPPPIESLARLIEDFSEPNLIVRELNARRALAKALFKRGDPDQARDVWAQGLRRAVDNGLDDVAAEIRADMLKSVGGEHLEEFAETIDIIGGRTGEERRFMRLRRLGRGGAGEVFCAIDLHNGRHVALKKVDLRGLSKRQRQTLADTIKTEFATAADLEDPRFARVLDLRMAPGGTLNIVQRFIEGPTLRDVYDTEGQPARLLGLLAGVAEALMVLHTRNIVHRDVKPDNVIVARGPRGGEMPVLIDLGIALIEGRDDVLKHFGTAPYVAPEQVAGRSVDHRADIYALGQMIAEIWGGRLPSRVGLGGLWPLGSADEMPRAMATTVRDMLAPDPARRADDLGAIADVLRSQSRQLSQD